MKHLILKPRNCGWSQYVVGALRLKALYGLIELPWWLKLEGTPITDPRRLLTDGKPAYFVGWDIASTPSVQVIRTWARPTAAFPMGSYKVEIDGKLVAAMGEFAQEGVPGSPYWHGGPPFAMWSGGSWPWKDEEVDDGIHE